MSEEAVLIQRFAEDASIQRQFFDPLLVVKIFRDNIRPDHFRLSASTQLAAEDFAVVNHKALVDAAVKQFSSHTRNLIRAQVVHK
jgi:LmbE family N-acetylglucosaminyl deacetylase